MSLENVNEICYRIMSFYNYNSSNKSNELEDYWANLLVAKELVNNKLLNKIDDYTKYINVFNYCIIFREELVNNELITNLLNNGFYDYNSILKMDRELNDEIVLSILSNINKNSDDLYDYRYHILKRSEISEYIKDDILNNYDKEELECNTDKIGLDLQDECSLSKIYTLDDLIEHKKIYHKYVAYNKMRNYLDKKVYKK